MKNLSAMKELLALKGHPTASNSFAPKEISCVPNTLIVHQDKNVVGVIENWTSDFPKIWSQYKKSSSPARNTEYLGNFENLSFYNNFLALTQDYKVILGGENLNIFWAQEFTRDLWILIPTL